MKSSTWEIVIKGKDPEYKGKEGDEYETSRMKVPGGWLVTHWVWPSETKDTKPSLAVVPDPDHLWELEDREWSDEPPTEPGLYFILLSDMVVSVARIFWSDDDGCLYARRIGRDGVSRPPFTPGIKWMLIPICGVPMPPEEEV